MHPVGSYCTDTYIRYINTYVVHYTHILYIYIYIYTHAHIHTYIHTYFVTYLLTPWSRVLLEKLTGLQLVKKFSAFYGTRRFITAFTSAHHLSLS